MIFCQSNVFVCFTFTSLKDFTFSYLSVIGKFDLTFFPLSSSNGLFPFSNGVDLYTNKLIKSVPSSVDFFGKSFTMFTHFSANPFDCRQFGLDLV